MPKYSTHLLRSYMFLSLIAKPIPDDIKEVRAYIDKRICYDISNAKQRLYRYKKTMRDYAEKPKPVKVGQPEKVLARQEIEEKVFRIVAGHLPRMERKAVLLRYRKHSEINEIAEEMNVTPRSASRYICVGLKKLRRFLAPTMLR